VLYEFVLFGIGADNDGAGHTGGQQGSEGVLVIYVGTSQLARRFVPFRGLVWLGRSRPDRHG
jgi:hypothetical protein